MVASTVVQYYHDTEMIDLNNLNSIDDKLGSKEFLLLMFFVFNINYSKFI